MRIIVAGDYAPLERIQKQINDGNFSQIFPQNLVDIITSADYSLVNFECPIIKNGFKPISKWGPNIGCSEKAVEALCYAGFKGVTLANNHILDYGTEGLQQTINSCKQAGLNTVGVGNNLEESEKILYVPIKGEKLAVINCCEHEFSVASDTAAGANPLNPVRLYNSLCKAKKQADYVMVIVHGGHEEYQLPSIRMQEIYRFIIDAGADAVINHHQHCFSGFETYKNKPIFYGLGNFCFDEFPVKNNTPWNYGYLIELSFNKQITYKLYPYNQYGNNPTVELLPEDYFDSDLKTINSIISDKSKLQKELESYYEEWTQSELSILEPYTGRILGKLLSLGLLPRFVNLRKALMLLNHIRCESHRDKLLFALLKRIG